MCIAAPGKVVRIEGKKAIVKYPDGEVRQAFIADNKPAVGSLVLVQMGIVVDILSKEQASSAAKAWVS